MLTQELLKEYLHYDPTTGIFTWIKKTRPSIKIGQKAGHVRQNGYIDIRIDGRLQRAHRLVWLYVYGYLPNCQMDHINHIRDDNRLCNLRLVSVTENNKNKSLSKVNKSGVNGVYWSKERRKWIATSCKKGRSVYLGGFEERWDAICARKSEEAKRGYHLNHGVFNMVYSR